ncbi:flavodoxin family protein [Methanobrevibacter sp.]|uniref:flavodoxin family protein n=1 Tax=Methanobrevibacter sp. TaxID=66852 RepID=UPI0025D7598D|nr:flavodoxin family protein [Methanobrevibacter sp.]MBQ2962886.1 flavodoxin family protein [Methanobrevibacter sp.]
MKTIVINADPKMKQEIAKLLKSAGEGAESVGSEVEYFDLYKLDMRGCMLCSICKKKNKESFKCYWRDDLSPIIEKILNADTLLIGSQIFFNEPTSHYRALVERLIYCIVSYDRNYHYKGNVNVGIFYSVISPKEHFKKNVQPTLKSTEDLFKMLNGEVKVYASYKGLKSHRKTDSQIKEKEEEFEIDLKNAYKIGAELSKIKN